MRRCGTLARQDHAERFADYLLSQDIKTRVEESNGNWSIWVLDDDRVPEAREELSAFEAEPDSERYTSAAAVAEAKRKEQVQRELEYRRNLHDVRKQWSQKANRGAPVMMLMLFASIAVTLLTRFGTAEPGTQAYQIFDFMVLQGYAPLYAGQLWRLFTPIFPHLGPFHLLFNMIWLWILGNAIERLRGSLRFVVLAMAASAISVLAQVWWSDTSGAGMSGVVYGLFGYVWMKSRYDRKSPLQIDDQKVILMIGWLFICMTPISLVPNVANAAHVAGLLVGMAAGLARTGLRRLQTR